MSDTAKARIEDMDLPELARKLAGGNCRAIQSLRVGLARKLVHRRLAAGLTQSEVARRAGIRPETLNRIEKAKANATTATVTKILRAIDRAERDLAIEVDADRLQQPAQHPCDALH